VQHIDHATQPISGFGIRVLNFAVQTAARLKAKLTIETDWKLSVRIEPRIRATLLVYVPPSLIDDDSVGWRFVLFYKS
jgi:hypothetical protein